MALDGGEAECPVLASEENEETQSAIALKACPSGYLLGARCEPMDRYQYFSFSDIAEAKAQYEALVAVMKRSGTPFGPLC